MIMAALAAGLRLGRALAERYTQQKGRMTEQLDVIKWACKELWSEVFRKQARIFGCWQCSNTANI